MSAGLFIKTGDLIGFHGPSSPITLIILIGPWNVGGQRFEGIKLWELDRELDAKQTSFTASEELDADMWVRLGNIVTDVTDWKRYIT